MLRSTLALVLICSLGLSRAASAESTKELLTSFGLFGVWSVDCRRDQAKEPFVGRTTYAISADGPVEVFSLSMANGEIVSWRKAIKSAQLVDGKLELITEEISVDSTNPTFDRRPEQSPEKKLIGKQGNRIITLDAHSVDGTKIFIRDSKLVLQQVEGTPLAGAAKIADRKILPAAKCTK